MIGRFGTVPATPAPDTSTDVWWGLIGAVVLIVVGALTLLFAILVLIVKLSPDHPSPYAKKPSVKDAAQRAEEAKRRRAAWGAGGLAVIGLVIIAMAYSCAAR